MRYAIPFRRRRAFAPWLPVLSLAMANVTVPAVAAESGTTYFALGAQTVYAGFMPAPGKTQFYGYSQFYDAPSLRDARGESIPGVEVQALAFAPRVVHTWERELWGFKLSTGALALLVNVGVKTPAGEEFDTGPVVAGLEPLNLTRSVGAWHFLVGSVLYFPWGDYDAQSTANTTLNRYGGALNNSVTWIPNSRWDISANFGYEFKGRNRDTGYRDGAQFGLTYGVGYRPFLQDLRWDVGFSGYYTVQVEDDRQSGGKIPDRRLRKLVVGPKLGYWFSPGTAVVLQWHKEYEARNAGRGDAYWVMFAFPLPS